MSKKVRIGSDPLSWIKTTSVPVPAEDSTELSPEEEGVLGTISKVPDVPRPEPVATGKKRNVSTLDNTGPSSNTGVQSKPENTSSAGLSDGWTRATLIARVEYLEGIKALAYFDRKQLKDVFDEAFAAYLKRRPEDLKQAELLYQKRKGPSFTP